MAQDYTYIAARMRALEASRPDAAWFQRITRAPSDSLLGSVREFFSGFDQVDSIYEFENGIESETSGILDLVESLLSDEDVIAFIRAGYDFDNMVHIWKAKMLGKKPFLNRFGLVDPEEIEQALGGSTLIWMPEYLKKLYERLDGVETSGDLQAVENEGEKAKWYYLLDRAPSEEAREYIVKRIDLANLKTFIRLKRTNLRKGSPSGMWIEGGEIDRATLGRLFKEPEDELYTYLNVTSYRGLVQKGLNRKTPLWKVENDLSSHLIDMIGDSVYRFFDLMPVVYHLQLRDRESRLLRIIFTGKINNLPDNRISEKVEAVIS